MLVQVPVLLKLSMIGCVVNLDRTQSNLELFLKSVSEYDLIKEKSFLTFRK
jgi:hypothetical protein